MTPQDLLLATEKVSDQLLECRLPSGHWEGELSASALATATAISAFSFYQQVAHANDPLLETIEQQVSAGIAWLMSQQNEDGGWGDTPKNYSNISTSMLVVAALHAAGRADEFADSIARAQTYIDARGGIAGLRERYGKDKTFAVPILANCAMAGIVPWKEVSALPFEAAVVPQRFYHWLQLPVVSYAIPALVAIGQAKFHFDPPWDPIRKTIRQLSIKPGLKVLERMQPASGGYLEAIPLTSFVSMSLIKCGRADHPVVQNGIRFLLNAFRQSDGQQKYKPEAQASESVRDTHRPKTHSLALRARIVGHDCGGTWPIDTNLAMWNTTLSINALSNHPTQFKTLLERDAANWQACVDWLLSCQNITKHPFTGAAPGGWGWSDLSGAVPDADDTPGALLALRRILDTSPSWLDAELECRIKDAAELGVQWLLGLQNRDGGWPTFCRGWGTLPFDRSGSDITAHVIRGLLAWEDLSSGGRGSVRAAPRNMRTHSHGSDGASPSPKQRVAIERGFRYLEKQQRADGSWLPLWFGNQDQPDEENPFYGTAKVLLAYRDAGFSETEPTIAGYKWLVAAQNGDGGWGGGDSIERDVADARLGRSSVEETALCCEALIGTGLSGADAAAAAGVDWLIAAVEQDCVQVSSPIGFYFAKLWYFEKLYPLVFATGALQAATFETVGRFAERSRLIN